MDKQFQILKKRLYEIKEAYHKLVYQLMDCKNPLEKKQLLKYEALLNDESKTIKEYMGILVEDPCPNSGMNIHCSECPNEKMHVANGTITEKLEKLEVGAYDRESDGDS